MNEMIKILFYKTEKSNNTQISLFPDHNKNLLAFPGQSPPCLWAEGMKFEVMPRRYYNIKTF